MSKKRKPNDFDALWNERYFYTNSPDTPPYNIYKELWNLGADLDYVEFLSGILLSIDKVIGLALQRDGKSVTKRRRRGTRQYLSFNPAIVEELGQGWVDAVNRASHDREEYENSLERALGLFIMKAVKPKQVESEMSAILEKMTTLQTILGADIIGIRRGRRSDRRGSFFLLALSEHLREKRRRPRHEICTNLLKKIRGQPLESRFQERTQAKARVGQFKNSNPDWKPLLRAIKRAYLRQGRKPRHFPRTERQSN